MVQNLHCKEKAERRQQAASALTNLCPSALGHEASCPAESSPLISTRHDDSTSKYGCYRACTWFLSSSLIFFFKYPTFCFLQYYVHVIQFPFGQGLIATFSRSRSARLGEAALPLVMKHLSKQSDCRCVCVRMRDFVCVCVCGVRTAQVALEALKSIQDAHLSMFRALLLFIFSLWFTRRYVVVLLLQSCVLQASLLC